MSPPCSKFISQFFDGQRVVIKKQLVDKRAYQSGRALWLPSWSKLATAPGPPSKVMLDSALDPVTRYFLQVVGPLCDRVANIGLRTEPSVSWRKGPSRVSRW